MPDNDQLALVQLAEQNAAAQESCRTATQESEAARKLAADKNSEAEIHGRAAVSLLGNLQQQTAKALHFAETDLRGVQDRIHDPRSPRRTAPLPPPNGSVGATPTIPPPVVTPPPQQEAADTIRTEVPPGGFAPQPPVVTAPTTQPPQQEAADTIRTEVPPGGFAPQQEYYPPVQDNNRRNAIIAILVAVGLLFCVLLYRHTQQRQQPTYNNNPVSSAPVSNAPTGNQTTVGFNSDYVRDLGAAL